MLPEGLGSRIIKGAWPVLPIFKLLQELGSIDEKDMFNTFNMGMVLAVSNDIADDIISYLAGKNAKAYLIGEITEGEAGVEIC